MLCPIPNNSFLSYLYISLPILDSGGGPAMVMSLLDTIAAPTTYISLSTKGTNFSVATSFTMADFVNNTVGTLYGGTLVAIGGAPGVAEAVWSSANLQLKVTTGAANTIGAAAIYIPYIIEFAPSYNAL